MRSLVLQFGYLFVCCFELTAASFTNLDFESVHIQRVLATAPTPDASDALPGWSVFNGYEVVPQVLYNGFSQTTTSATLWDAGPSEESQLQGRFFFGMSAGLVPETGTRGGVSIFQTGDIPSEATSIRFLAAAMPEEALQLTVDGRVIPIVKLEARIFNSRYGANIGDWAGKTAEIRFSVLPVTGQVVGVNLDGISFSPIAVVPEPGVGVLTALGSLILGTLLLSRRV